MTLAVENSSELAMSAAIELMEFVELGKWAVLEVCIVADRLVSAHLALVAVEHSMVDFEAFQALEVFAFEDSLGRPFVDPLEHYNWAVHSSVDLEGLAFDPLDRLVATHEEAKKLIYRIFTKLSFYFFTGNNCDIF